MTIPNCDCWHHEERWIGRGPRNKKLKLVYIHRSKGGFQYWRNEAECPICGEKAKEGQ